MSLDLVLKEGFNIYELEENNINIIANNYNASVIKINNLDYLNINFKGLNNSNTSLLIWNNTNHNIDFIENYNLDADSNLKIAYLDINEADLNRKTIIDLNGRNSNCELKSATLCSTNKKYEISINSNQPYTNGNMENFSVVVGDGKYHMNASGVIKKGSYKSSSHQTSRALCFSNTLNATIIPQLIIDDNDVLASHATTLGRIDENQMIYLLSRGLNEDEIMSLVSVGYLLPIADFIDNKELSEVIRNSIEGLVKTNV